MATHHEEKIREDAAKLVKIKVYFPSVALLEWRESVATTPGEPTEAVAKLKAFTKALEKELGVKASHTGFGIAAQGAQGNAPQGAQGITPVIVVKTMNNRYKLAGDFCVRLYYATPGASGTGASSATSVHFPADPTRVAGGDPKVFLATYTKISSAYSVSKDYVKSLRERITVLRDEF